jgi:hypothetical protein
LIGRRGPYPGACSGIVTTIKNVVKRSSDRGMDHASIINFLSNEKPRSKLLGFSLERRGTHLLPEILKG